LWWVDPRPAAKRPHSSSFTPHLHQWNGEEKGTTKSRRLVGQDSLMGEEEEVKQRKSLPQAD